MAQDFHISYSYALVFEPIFRSNGKIGDMNEIRFIECGIIFI